MPTRPCAWAPRLRGAFPPIAAGLFILQVAAGTVVGQEWRPPIRTVLHVVVKVDVLGVRSSGTVLLASGTVDAAPGRPGTTLFPLAFETARARLDQLEMVVEDAGSTSERLHLKIVSTVAVRGRGKEPVAIQRERDLEVSEGSSILHQVYEGRHGESSLVVMLTPESREIPELITAPSAFPVTFMVSLSRLVEGNPVEIETDVLRTLEGAPVSYAFRISPERPLAPDPASASPSDSPPSPHAPPRSSIPDAPPPAPTPDAPPPEPASVRSTGNGDPAKAGTRPEASPPSAGGPVGAASPPGAGEPAGAASAAAPTVTEEIELTLLPRRMADGILLVEATLAGSVSAEAAADDRAVLLRRTEAVTKGESFALTLGEGGPGGPHPYRFVVRADF